MKSMKFTSVVPNVSTRASIRNKTKNSLEIPVAKGKRKADASPVKMNITKRSALGDVTNAVNKNKLISKTKPAKANGHSKQSEQERTATESTKTVLKPRPTENCVPLAPITKPQTRASLKNGACLAANETAQKPKNTTLDIAVKVKPRLSHEFEKNDTLYSSALEDVNISTLSNISTKPLKFEDSGRKSVVSIISHQFETKLNLNLGDHDVPKGIDDFDKLNWDDVFQISHYAMDIFNYMKTREPDFLIDNYMPRQTDLTKWMRSLLVDWMVDVQESFELNHETLYLGVKLVDLYLSKAFVRKEYLQLVGAAAMFVASKYDERMPPLVDDFLYICDGAYKRRDLLRMEINLLKICNFDLGLPLSYRFLRRYARCANVTMPILTLARYILEFSLMDYSTITMSESKQAAATLYMALKMKGVSGWTRTLEFYTGYKLTDFTDIVLVLNYGLHRKNKEQLMTVKNKYSHKIFYEVAKTPLLGDMCLLGNVDSVELEIENHFNY